MEYIFPILIIYLVISAIWRAIAGSGVTGSALSFKIEELPQEEKINDLKDTKMFGVYIKGNPKITLYEDTAACFKLYDAESGLVIQSTFENTSEVNGRGFEHIISLGSEMAGKYWPDWVRISALIPESLIGPYKGRRKLLLKCTFWPVNSVPIYDAGIIPQEYKQYENSFGSVGTYRFDFDLINSGYLELDNERLEIQKASIKLAVSIALADGSLDQQEGNQIKKWIKGIVDSTSDTQKESIGKTAGDKSYYHLQRAKELAKKDGHDYDKLPQYDRTSNKHKDHYHDMAKKESVKKESTMSFREKLVSLYEGDRAAHYKGATKPEEYDEKQKSSKGAMDMLKTPKSVEADGMKAAKDTAANIAKSAPGKKLRKGDNPKGDTAIIPAATPVNDPAGKTQTMENYGISGNKVSNSLLDAIAMVEDMDKKMTVDIDHMTGTAGSHEKKHNITLKKSKNYGKGPGSNMSTFASGKKKDLQTYLKKHYDGDHKTQHPEIYK